jgi:L-2-hydroxyglutarate oxidase LhgO
LCSDQVAALAGLDIEALGYRLRYVKGHYFRVAPRKQHLARHLIYPVPPKENYGLGIHVTLELDGAMRLGPDGLEVDRERFDYDVPAQLASPFHQAVSRYLDGLELADLSPDQSGVRPKLGPAGAPMRDFVIAEESAHGAPGWVNLVGIESPGLTAALPIGERVAALL